MEAVIIIFNWSTNRGVIIKKIFLIDMTFNGTTHIFIELDSDFTILMKNRREILQFWWDIGRVDRLGLDLRPRSYAHLLRSIENHAALPLTGCPAMLTSPFNFVVKKGKLIFFGLPKYHLYLWPIFESLFKVLWKYSCFGS